MPQFKIGGNQSPKAKKSEAVKIGYSKNWRQPISKAPKIRGGWNSLLQKLEVIEEILCVARRRTRSIVSLCEELDDRRKVQNLPIRTIFYDTSRTD